ncbi:MAG: hypothetical protein Q8Q08_00980 [Candidatus Omnitrophota bacterium]|nr:hypothetical protein [Candidatus Omnitrophota bacterium]
MKKLTADQLSELLFEQFVLEDEVNVQTKDLGPYIINTYSQNLIFKKHVFFYLCSLIAVALTEEFEIKEGIADVIYGFRQRVLNEALKRWNMFQAEADNVIEEASAVLGKLLFVNPKSNCAVSFEWARDYFGQTMIDEMNPITLFKISTFWKTRYLAVAQLLRAVEVVLDKN